MRREVNMQFNKQAAEEQRLNGNRIAHLHDDFYRDGFQFIWLSIALTVSAIGLLIIISLYFFLHQVLPVTFSVYEDFRVQADVRVDKPYVHTPDLLQWASNAVPALFIIDFIDYNQSLQELSHYFTVNGWAKYLSTANVFINHDDIV